MTSTPKPTITTIRGRTPGMQRPRDLEIHSLADGHLQLQVQRPGHPETGWAILLDAAAVQKLLAALGALPIIGASPNTTRQ